MRCLYCDKELTSKVTPEELENRWHKKCVKEFFECENMPFLDVDEKYLLKYINKDLENINTVAGVQKKLSLNLEKEKKPRLKLVNYPSGYIIKPQAEEYDKLPEAEFLVMQMAKEIGIKTVPFGLIKNENNKLSYITKRIDRRNLNNKLQKLAMEDFCQLDERLTEDKYKGSYERCAKIIKKYSEIPGYDLTELFIRLVFSYIIGNSDMHLKNFSMIEQTESSCKYVLSNAYDLLPVNIIIPNDLDEFALTMCGKKRDITRNNFIEFGESIGIEKKVSEKLIDSLINKKDKLLLMCEQSYLSKEMKESLKELINIRIKKIS